MCELESFLNSCQAFFPSPLSLFSPFPCTEIALQTLTAYGKTQSDRWTASLPPPAPAQVMFCCQDGSALAGRGTSCLSLHSCRDDSGCGNQAAAIPLPHERKSRLHVTQSDFFERKSCCVKWVFPFSSFHARIALSLSKRQTFM